MNADHASTLVGGGYGMYLLSTVKWEAVPYGECVKIAVAVLAIALGTWLYSKRQSNAVD